MVLGAAYVTLGQMKDRLNITDTVDDDRISSAIKAATEGINLACGRDFQKETVATARTYRPTHGELVTTHDFHTTTGLVIKTDTGDDGAYSTTLTASAYELEPADGVQGGRTGWPYWKIRLVDGTLFPHVRRRGVQVTAQWGWGAVPLSVIEATEILTEELFKLKDTPFGSGGFSEYGRIRARENPHVALLIGDFRRVGHRLRVA